MYSWLTIGIGGFIGALTRYYVSGFAQNLFAKSSLPFFPFGTLTVNIFGCFLIGLFSTLFLERDVDVSYRFLINTGFLGAFTTFSTFSLETLNLIEEKALLHGFVNIFFSCLVGLIAVWLGKVTFRLIWG